MAKEISARKRRRIDGTNTATSASINDNAPVFDDEAMKQHMLSLLQDKRKQANQKDDESDEGSGIDGSDSEEADDSEGDDEADEADDKDASRGEAGGRGSVNRHHSEDLDSEEEDLDEAARALLSNSNKSDADQQYTQETTSRISRIPVDRTSKQTAKAPALKTTFEGLGLSVNLIRTLAGISIRKPTEIQSACFEPILSGRDCVGGAKTGSGKTMAFALPILQRIVKDPFGIFAVVLTPTRELAYQLSEQFIVLGKPLGLTTVTVVGGMDMMQQARELAGRPHVVVATPGRLHDLLKNCAGDDWDLSRVKVVVLDEADRLLTPSFAPNLQFLFGNMPENRQTCLFTATISDAIEALASRPPRPGKQQPFIHRVESDTKTVANLRQEYLFVPSFVKETHLHYLLTHPPKEIQHLRRNTKRDDDNDESTSYIPSTIIFTQRCATAHLVHLMLHELDIPSVPLHSHLSQPERLQSLTRFRSGGVPILVTTDVGSRGLDIPEVALVLNYDCPRAADDYIHRVGRTARAGRGGLAITFVTERDTELVKGIEDVVGVQLSERVQSDNVITDTLNIVSTAKRVASMAMHDSGFGERQATNKAKAIKRARRDAKAKNA
ncbi:putative RNA helicase [Naganishia friedmannii]|uniref:RNA helicase n=1 Tax=Naganishia friedmannii TaxID=89922 RepID=A0ACC2VY52_9TREE|nr:putative RNA helicase [Naganishia friedmannii]